MPVLLPDPCPVPLAQAALLDYISPISPQATGARGANAAQYKQQLRSEVTWLRKTPIMGNNLYDSIHKQQKQNAYANPPPAP